MNRSSAAADVPPARFVVGIDLGTTNSALAFVDTAAGPDAPCRHCACPQLVAPGEVEARDTLPSFHYEPAPNQLGADALRLPWNAPATRPRRSWSACWRGIAARTSRAASSCRPNRG